MEIYIPRRKNDQYNLGHKVFISRSSKDTCPVTISSSYLKLLPQNPDQSLVCRLSYSRHGYIAHQQAISYSRVREIFLSALKDVLPDISGYGTTHQLDSHADWKSADSKHSYVELDLNNNLAVSRSLNL